MKKALLFTLLIFSHLVYSKGSPSEIATQLVTAQEDVRDIQKAMRKAPNDPIAWQYSNLTLKEIFFETKILYQKVDSLAESMTGYRYPNPPAMNTPPNEDLIYKMLVGINANLARIKMRLGIIIKNPTPTTSKGISLGDAFNRIRDLNAQVNTLFSTPVSPNEAFNQLEQCIFYADYLIEEFNQPNLKEIPYPKYQGGKTSIDIYRQLVISYQTLENVMLTSGVNAMKLQVNPKSIKLVNARDILDFTQFIRMQIQSLYMISHGGFTPPEKRNMGKVSSQVYQEAVFFQSHLDRLQRLVWKNPHWLSDKKRQGTVREL